MRMFSYSCSTILLNLLLTKTFIRFDLMKEEFIKLFVKIRWSLIILSCGFVSVFSLTVLGQDTCTNAAGIVYCDKNQDAACSVTGEGKFDGNCNNRNAQLYFEGTEAEFAADYYYKVSGTRVSPAEIKNKKYQDQLNNGRIEKSDGTIITFTPIERVKTAIKETQQQNYLTPSEKQFILRNELDGPDKAIEEYKKNLGNSTATPVRPKFFLTLGKALMQVKKLNEAVKILSLNAEINKSPEAQMELLNAQIEQLTLNGEKDKAVNVLNNVVKDKNTSIEVKNLANEKLVKLRDQ